MPRVTLIRAGRWPRAAAGVAAVWAILFFCGGAAPPASAQTGEPVDAVLFYGRGCPYCASMRDYLTGLRKAHPEIRLHEYEVYFNSDNARLF